MWKHASSTLENYFKPHRNQVYERYVSILLCKIKESQLTVTSLAFVNLHRLASSSDELIRDKMVIGLNDGGTSSTKQLTLRVLKK